MVLENERCKGYCGLTCVDGTCPMANRDEYAERGYYLIQDCDECFYYEGCKDCYFEGTEHCVKNTKENQSLSMDLIYPEPAIG